MKFVFKTFSITRVTRWDLGEHMYKADVTRCVTRNVMRVTNEENMQVKTKNQISSSKTSSLKHLPNGSTSAYFSFGISWVNSKSFHHASIMSFSITSIFPLFVNSTRDLDVAKIGVSALRQKSFEKWFLGEMKCTGWLYNKSNSSFHAINSFDHLNSVRNIISFSTVSTQAYLSSAGFAKALDLRI